QRQCRPGPLDKCSTVQLPIHHHDWVSLVYLVTRNEDNLFIRKKPSPRKNPCPLIEKWGGALIIFPGTDVVPKGLGTINLNLRPISVFYRHHPRTLCKNMRCIISMS